MPFACIFVPDFPVEALLRAEPELRSQAVAVLEGKAPLQKIFAVNEKARRAAISPGMTKLQVEACPDLVLRPRSFLQEAAAHAALLDCAQSFSPRVEDAGCDNVLLDLAGLEPLFGPLPKIARDLARRASDLGLEVNVAVASNPDTAALAAHGFSGVIVIPEGKEAEQLGNLPLEVLFTGDCNPQTLEILERWGIRNLRALAALPEIALSERLGQDGIRLQQLARGGISRNLVPVEPPLAFEEAIELEYPLLLLEPLAFLLSRLLEQLCARLSARALATQELRLSLTLDQTPDAECSGTNQVGTDAPRRAPARRHFQRTLHLPVPLLDVKIFLKLLQLDLNAHPPGAPIVKIHLSAEPVRPRAAQSGLFLPPSPEPEKLELTLARIAGIVGQDKVGSLQMLDTHRPEGFLMRHFAPSRKDRDKDRNGDSKPAHLPGLNQSAPNQGRENPVTALRIFRPPLRAAVTLREGRPARIVCQRRKEICGEVLWAAGPWRTSGDWWEQEGWAHDEWDIALQEVAGITLYRLVRDLLSGQWRLEGSYD
ncbi:MAG TPA: DNA polymerase Y family protein [Terriglobales bacterium]|jgi:protein ImuB|nr:DNA polymerase Y family protein [Terriglobales bacterium]